MHRKAGAPTFLLPLRVEKGFGEADDVGNNPTLWSVLFGKKITYNQGPEGPSQIRYVHYVEAMLYSGNLYKCVYIM